MSHSGVTEPSADSLVERYYEPLYRFGLSLSGAEAAAADLTQETFYLWVLKGGQLRDKSKAKTWLFTTLYREFLSGQKHDSRFRYQDLDQSADELPAVEPTLANDLDAGLVMEALHRVDAAFRAPLTLFYLQELSYQEIAETMEIPIGTVMSRLSRGKEQLRRLMADVSLQQDSKIVRLPVAKAETKPDTGRWAG